MLMAMIQRGSQCVNAIYECSVMHVCRLISISRRTQQSFLRTHPASFIDALSASDTKPIQTQYAEQSICSLFKEFTVSPHTLHYIRFCQQNFDQIIISPYYHDYICISLSRIPVLCLNYSLYTSRHTFRYHVKDMRVNLTQTVCAADIKNHRPSLLTQILYRSGNSFKISSLDGPQNFPPRINVRRVKGPTDHQTWTNPCLGGPSWVWVCPGLLITVNNHLEANYDRDAQWKRGRRHIAILSRIGQTSTQIQQSPPPH